MSIAFGDLTKLQNWAARFDGRVIPASRVTLAKVVRLHHVKTCSSAVAVINRKLIALLVQPLNSGACVACRSIRTTPAAPGLGCLGCTRLGHTDRTSVAHTLRPVYTIDRRTAADLQKRVRYRLHVTQYTRTLPTISPLQSPPLLIPCAHSTLVSELTVTFRGPVKGVVYG